MRVKPRCGTYGPVVLIPSSVDPALLIVSGVDSEEALLVDLLVYICCQGPPVVAR